MAVLVDTSMAVLVDTRTGYWYMPGILLLLVCQKIYSLVSWSMAIISSSLFEQQKKFTNRKQTQCMQS